MTKKSSTWKKVIDYIVKTMNGMAYGLFATLIIGVIIGQIGKLTGIGELTLLSEILKGLLGIGIALGVAWSLELKGLKLITAGAIGGIVAGVAQKNGVKTDPMVAYLVAVGTIELINLIFRKPTPVDIIIIPLVSSIIALVLSLIISYPVAAMMDAISTFVKDATDYSPFFMGIIISLVMGMALTAPISSAAIAIAIKLDGIAGGAALAGCSAQMIGFAIQSLKDNDLGVVLSVGFGTSMLQFKNIVVKPLVWLPTMIVSMITGPLATLVFKAKSTAIGAGMGTSGLVGQFATIDAMGANFDAFITIALLHFVIPIVLVYIIDRLFRKFGWIKKGDLKV